MQRCLSDLQSKALLPAVAIRGTTRSDGYSYRAKIPLEKSVPKVIAKTSLKYIRQFWVKPCLMSEALRHAHPKKKHKKNV